MILFNIFTKRRSSNLCVQSLIIQLNYRELQRGNETRNRKKNRVKKEKKKNFAERKKEKKGEERGMDRDLFTGGKTATRRRREGEE